MLEANDYRNAVALINRANVQGTEVEDVARLKQKLLQHAEHLDKLDQEAAKMDTPHAPTMAEVRDLERG